VETINTKSTDYLTSAQSDILANTTGNGYKTKSAKLSDIDMLTADYKSKLALYASNSSAASTPSISQVTRTDYSGFLSNLIDENDFMRITIDNTEITQQFDTDVQTTLKKFSDKISNVQGLSSSIDSTGLLTINSLVPGKELRIIDAKLNNDDVYPVNTVEAKIGSGLGLVESSKNALESALQKAGAQLLTINSKVDLTGQENLNVNKMQLSLSNLKLTNNLGEVEIKDGIVYSKDGENKFVIGKIQTAQFTNEQGLSPIGGNLYQVSKESGGAIYAGNSNKLISSGLEQSKANLGNSLTALLIYQKAFEANSKSITTSDEMLQTAIQLKK
jgi:flagellar hook protein FlgE